MANQIDLNNNVAVVTGGAQGIGRAVTERFLQSGAKVAIWDVDTTLAEATAAELADMGEVVAIACDITDLAAVEAAREATLSRFGQIDILVNNAGIAGLNTTVWEYPPEEWHRVMAINLHGTFNTCRAISAHMRSRGYGRIVNVASIAGKEGNPNASAYSASKAAVIGLTKSLGKELADMDISVNCVTPAAARTRIFDQMTEEHIAYMLSKIPRARFVTVDEVAAVIAFAASPECTYTTGAVFDVSGGRATY